MIVYDNSERERVETFNRFHSNMHDIASGMTTSHLLFERNDDWMSMYYVYKKPVNYWYSWLNKLITNEPIYRRIGRIEIFENSSVKIDVFEANEVFDRIAQYLDKDKFRVTVYDRSVRSI